MANSDRPLGLRPLRSLSGGVIRFNEYEIATGYTTSIYTGDPVKLVAGGTIEQAAAGDVILGVFQGCVYVNTDGKPRFSPYWPASTSNDSKNAKAKVIDDPDIVFAVQASGNTVVADRGQCADITVGTGSTVTGLSAVELDTSGQGASTAQLKILDKVDEPKNDWGTNVKLEVVINEHFLKATAGI